EPSADEVEPDEVEADEAEEGDEAPKHGAMAVPFGPFIALAALEHFFLGEFLPTMVSMSYLYTHGAW
ncbi:MAG: hypothetical protein ACOCV2_13810, partial [Persicimonas sp.]